MRTRAGVRDLASLLVLLGATGLAWANAAVGAIPEPWATRLWVVSLFAVGLAAAARWVAILPAFAAAATAAAAGLALEAWAIAEEGFAHRHPTGRWWAGLGWAAYELPVVLFALSRGSERLGGRLLTACLASLALGAVSDPLGLAAGRWTWPGGGPYASGVVGFDGSAGIPLTNFLSWALVPALSVAVLHAWARYGAPPRGRPLLLPALLAVLLAQALALGLLRPAAAGLVLAGMSALVVPLHSALARGQGARAEPRASPAGSRATGSDALPR